ncbi:MAG: tRNA (adenosine(37)-N6)-threonylcarbamoyltransferase complex ATPase subunit type 1 TsaE [Planctomycetota bacterium]|nr:tRNA (adenosine(37)-N6)-threonylcarbamoyltransferase complex ATPase subunit type 1 TsaE [Planctomycetota bacterium]
MSDAAQAISDDRAEVWQGTSDSIERTVALGAAVGAAVRAGDVVALVGELGAGKTQFVRGLAQGMGIDPRAVASPTFVLSQEHPPARGGLVLVHIDAYRLRGAEDLESIGWDGDGAELRRGAVLAIEWADRLGSLLGRDALIVSLAHEEEGRRRIVVEARGAWRDRGPALAASLSRAAATSC